MIAFECDRGQWKKNGRAQESDGLLPRTPQAFGVAPLRGHPLDQSTQAAKAGLSHAIDSGARLPGKSREFMPFPDSIRPAMFWSEPAGVQFIPTETAKWNSRISREIPRGIWGGR